MPLAMPDAAARWASPVELAQVAMPVYAATPSRISPRPFVVCRARKKMAAFAPEGQRIGDRLGTYPLNQRGGA